MVVTMRNPLFRFVQLIVAIILLVQLTACVTTERGGISSKVNDQKTLDYSVKLAMSYIRNGNWDAAKR